MYNKADYRIRSNKKTQDDFDFDLEEHLKVSTHIHQHQKKESFGQLRKFRQSSQNSRVKESRVSSAFSKSMVGSRVARVLRRSKNQNDKNAVTDIEFNNVRWISIVSAYDSKRLRHVTVSKQSCENFLKKHGNGIRKDPAAMAYFKDIKKHFHSWLTKINETFVVVLNHFLSNTDKSALMELEKVNPILEQIRSDTQMMKEKLEGCLKYHQNNDFRKMAEKFKSFFTFSGRLQELICIIFEKKQKIDSLFYELESGGNIDKNLQRIRKEGIKETKKIIYSDKEHYDVNLCEKIMGKVGRAINEMASKGLNIFHKLRGAKELIIRIRRILNDAHKRLTIKEIKSFSDIFNEILEETDSFQTFVNQFDSQNDFVTPQLREKIHQCRQDLIQKKRAVGQMQSIFVGTVITQTIDILSHSHSLNQALNLHNSQYHQYNHLLEAIANAMLDQTKRTITEGLVKQNRIAFSRVQDDIEKIKANLKRHKQGFIIDTQDGQVASMECNKLTKHYKDKIKSLIKKHEEALKQLDVQYNKVKLPNSEQDAQVSFLSQLVSLTEVVNSRERQKKVGNQKGFHELKEGLAVSSAELSRTKQILEEFQDIRKAIRQLNQKNPLKQLIKEVATQNGLYLECDYLLCMFKITPQISQRNIIDTIGKINDLNKKRKMQLGNQQNYKPTKAYRYVLDRIYCLVLTNGLKKNAIKAIDDSKFLNFPESDVQQKQMENQVKYRTLITQTLGEEAQLAKEKLKNSINVMKDLISARSVIEKLKLNQNGEYIALTNIISNFTSQMFKICLLNPKKQILSTQTRRIVLQLSKCLKNKSINIDTLEGQLDITNSQAFLRVRKEFIFFKNINQNALKSCEELSRAQDYDPLKTLSKVTQVLAEYLHLAKQPVYLALNQWRQPVWIGAVQQSKTGICSQLDLNGYPRGTFTDIYTHEAPKVYDEKRHGSARNLSPLKESGSKQLPKGSAKMIVKQKSHPKESMDQQIIAFQSDKDMEMEVNIEEMAEQDMGEQIEEMEENYEDDMEEDIGDQMGSEVNEEGAMQQDMTEELQGMEVKISKPPMLAQTKTQQGQKKEQQKPAKKKVIQKSVYQIIPFFRQLEQIQDLLEKINFTEKLFWKENVDFQQIQDYYHREEDLKDRNNFIKSLENCFSMFLGSRFGAKLGEAVKNLDKLKTMKGLFLSLGQKNWINLFKILSIIERNYSIITNQKAEVLQLFIFDGDSREFRKQTCKKCIHDYLERTFKTSFFNPDTFDYEGYISTCLKVSTQELINSDGVSFHYIIKYIAKSVDCLPDADSHKKLKELKEIEKLFEKQMKTGINIGYTSLQFWVKTVAPNSQDCYKPDYSTLDGYLKQLNRIEKKQSIYHYLTELKDNLVSLKNKIKTHKNNFDNLLFKIDNSNILDCLTQLSSLYQTANTSKLFLDGKEGKKSLIYIYREENEGVMNETSLSDIFLNIFSRLRGKQAETVISSEKIIEQVQKILSDKNSKTQCLSYLMEFLNILEIEHYFINKPNFLFKNNLDSLVLSILKPLGITKTLQLNYEELYKQLFNVNKKTFSIQLSLKPKINHKILTQEHITQTQQNLKKLESTLNKTTETFKSVIKSIDMSSVLIDNLLDKSKDNELISTILNYRQQLKEQKHSIDSTLGNKQENLLIYVHEHRTAVEKVTAQIDQKINEISSLNIQPSKNKDITSRLTSINLLFTELKTWAKGNGLAKDCTCYILISDDENTIINIQFSVAQNERKKSKQFLQKLLSKHWLPDKDWQNTWNYLYQKYIDKQVKIQIGAGGISCIYYNLKSAVKKIMQDVRLDLAQKTDIIDLIRNYNKYKFIHCSQSFQLMNKCHSQVLQKLNLKKELIYMQKIIRASKFQGVRDIPIVKSLFGCLKDQLDLEEEELQNLIDQTQAIKGKEANLSKLRTWYRSLGRDKLECQYYQLNTSTDTPIAILPVLKIQKDKSKNQQQIQTLLKEIKLSSAFQIKLVQGIQKIHITQQTVKCILRDDDKYLDNNTQVNDFQPDIAEGQMLVLVVQQKGGEIVPLWISEIVGEASVRLQISEERTVCQLWCGIWRIGKEDYQNVKEQKMEDKDEERRVIHKKLRGLASPEEQSKEVSVGQEVFFDSVGNWLKDQLKKHQNKVQQMQKVQLQRQKQLQQQRKEETAFLELIEKELKQQNIQVNHMTAEDIQKFRKEYKGEQIKELKGFFKKISDKTVKIIQKLQENKSLQDVKRLDSLTKTYISALEMKLMVKYNLQKEIKDKAEVQFSKILNERVKKRKEEKRASALRIPSTQLLKPPEYTKEEEKKVSEEEIDEQVPDQDIDVIELIFERQEIKDSKVEQFLIEWLEFQELKDPDYFRCLLAQFCKLKPSQIEQMTSLQ